MQTLIDYLEESGASLPDFAHLVGVSPEELSRVIAGADACPPALAQRIVDASGGAVALADLIGMEKGLIDLRGEARAASAELDAAVLAAILGETLGAMLGGRRRKGDRVLAQLAAEAAINAYAALSSITTRSGADRLSQALRPVLAEILAESDAPPVATARLDEMTARAAALYFQALRSPRPA